MTEQIKKENKRVEINSENPFALIGAYGTLRGPQSGSGGYIQGNYRGLLEGKSEYLGTYLTEPKFTLYGKNAGFPVLRDSGTTAVEYDLFKITDPKVLERVHSLEGCTGIIDDPRNWYNLKEIQNVEHGTFYIYIQSQERSIESIIHSGNWLKR